MTLLDNLKQKNGAFPVYSVRDVAFKPYGRVIDGYDTRAIVAASKAVPQPESGSAYVPTEPSLEATELAKTIGHDLFGELPAQIGLCWGHNTKLNALEYHLSSEINIAATPLVLLLAKEDEITDGKIDASCVKAFVLEEGDMVEVYGTSLHYCPLPGGRQRLRLCGCVTQRHQSPAAGQARRSVSVCRQQVAARV